MSKSIRFLSMTLTIIGLIALTGCPNPSNSDNTGGDAVAVADVTLEEETAEIAVDATTSLTATVSPEEAADKSVTWSSSDEEVATVDTDGTVTGVAEGTATITVTTTDGGKTADCEITVVDAAEIVPVSGVTLDKETLTVGIDATGTLTATVEPADATEKNVTWSSGDEDVATVDADGTVTGVAEGTATITVTTTDGAQTATAEVTVVDPVAVTGVAFDGDSLELAVGATEELAPTVEPANATDSSVSFTSNDEEVVTVDAEGLVTAVAVGTAEITVTTTDGEFTDTLAVTVVEPVAVTSVELVETLEVNKGGSAVLSSNIKPDNAADQSVEWTVSDETIVSLSEASAVEVLYGDPGVRVSGDEVGTTTITVTTNDGELTATCEVTVVENPNEGTFRSPVALTTGTAHDGKAGSHEDLTYETYSVYEWTNAADSGTNYVIFDDVTGISSGDKLYVAVGDENLSPTGGTALNVVREEITESGQSLEFDPSNFQEQGVYVQVTNSGSTNATYTITVDDSLPVVEMAEGVSAPYVSTATNTRTGLNVEWESIGDVAGHSGYKIVVTNIDSSEVEYEGAALASDTSRSYDWDLSNSARYKVEVIATFSDGSESEAGFKYLNL